MRHAIWLRGRDRLGQLRAVAGRRWQALTDVQAADPMQRIISKGFATVVLVAGVSTTLMVPVSLAVGETWVFIGSLLTVPFHILIWWLNRRGTTTGAKLYVAWIMLLLTLAMDPRTYVGPATPIPLVLIFPVIVATFFIRPRAGLLAALLLMVMLGVRIGFSPVSREDGQRFLLIGTVNLVAITIFLMTSAMIALRALRESIVANSKLHKLNDALAQAEERYRGLFENAVEGIFQTTPSGVMVTANPALAQMLGYSSPQDLMRLPETSDQLYAHIPQNVAIKGLLEELGSIEQFETEIYRQDGSSIWVLVNARVVRDEQGGIAYYEGIARDISERKRAEERLRESEARYRTLVEHAPEAIVVIDARTGAFVEANENAVRLFGCPKARLLGQGLVELSPLTQRDGRSSAEIAAAATQEAAEGGTPVFEWTCHGADGKTIPCEVRLVRLPASGQVLVRGSITDISDRKGLEAQLRQAQKMEAVGQLAGGVAHDFNNLLTAILSYAELARLHLDGNSELDEDLAQIQKAGQRAAALTHQLLAFSRRQVLQPSLLNPNAVVGEVVQLLHRLIGEDIELAVRLDLELGLVRADPNQTQQALLNLAVNARDAMPQGGTLTIETSNLELDHDAAQQLCGAAPGSYVRVAVSDTGHGMDAETQARIFEPFFTSKPVGQGTGLGLAMVHGFVSQSGGFITVQSAPGGGTSFQIYLPRVTAAAPVAIASQPVLPVTHGSETILLVEDDPTVRGLARQILDQHGYRVLEAAHGLEAVELLQGGPAQVDMVITDVVMPGGLSGPQVVERLLSLRPALRVLYMSGYTDSTVVRHGVQELNQAFLQKPFTPDSLARKVREVLDVR